MLFQKKKSTLEKVGEGAATVGLLALLTLGAIAEAANESERERRVRRSETAEEKALRKASLRMELDRINLQLRREWDWNKATELRQQKRDLEDLILSIG